MQRFGFTYRPRSGVVFAAALLLGLSACDTLKEQAGLAKRAPDEFTVIIKAPLVMPPDFSLRPPRPGAKGPQEIQPTELARTALFSGSRATASQARQAGEKTIAGAAGAKTGKKAEGAELVLLQQAGAVGASSSIRQIVNRETSVLAEKDKSFTDRLIFWQKKAPHGEAVDAGKEAKRLREVAASGETASDGETPVIKRRKRGWLEGVF